MTTYREGDAQRMLVLVPDGAGGWTSAADEGTDPMWTLVRRFGRADTVGATLVNAASATLHTPAAGKAVRLKWIYLGSPSDSAETVATISFGANATYQVPLPAPGVFVRTSIREGGTDEPLKIDLWPSTRVYVNYELEEF